LAADCEADEAAAEAADVMEDFAEAIVLAATLVAEEA